MMIRTSQKTILAHHAQSLFKKDVHASVQRFTEDMVHSRDETCHCLKRTASEEHLMLVLICFSLLFFLILWCDLQSAVGRKNFK